KETIMNKLAMKLAKKYLSPTQKTLFELFSIGTSIIIVQKWKERYVAGVGESAIEKLQNKGYDISSIYQKTDAVPYEINIHHKIPLAPLNVMLNAGIDEIWNLVVVAGGSVVAYDNTNARTGVGDSATGAVATQTGLQAATNKTFKAMDATYPLHTAQQWDGKSTYGSTDANYSWQ